MVSPSTIACGYCADYRTGYNAQCDNANPNGPAAGTAFFGRPKASGPSNIPPLIDLVQARAFDPQPLLTQQTELVSALEAYESFDARQSGWLKVELVPAGGQGPR